MAIEISNKAQETYQYQTDSGAIRKGFLRAVKGDTLSFPGKTKRRDVFEHSDSNSFFTGGYDTLSSEEIKSFKYKIEHTVNHYASWFSEEVGKDLQEIKEEKGYYKGSDILNAYGYAYARLYAEIEQRYQNGDEQWFDATGKPLTKEKEIEELNKAYEGAAEWATKCAEVMADIQNVHWTSLFGPAQNYDRPAPEVLKPQQKDPEEMKLFQPHVSQTRRIGRRHDAPYGVPRSNYHTHGRHNA